MRNAGVDKKQYFENSGGTYVRNAILVPRSNYIPSDELGLNPIRFNPPGSSAYNESLIGGISSSEKIFVGYLHTSNNTAELRMTKALEVFQKKGPGILNEEGIISSKPISDMKVDKKDFDIYEYSGGKGDLDFNNMMVDVGFTPEKVTVRTPQEYRQNQKEIDKDQRKKSFFGYIKKIDDLSLVLVRNPNDASFNIGYFRNPHNNPYARKDSPKSYSEKDPDTIKLYDSLIVKLKPGIHGKETEWGLHTFSDNGVSFDITDVLPIRWDKNMFLSVGEENIVKNLKKKAKKNRSLVEVMKAVRRNNLR